MSMKMSFWILPLFLLAFVCKGTAGECSRPVLEGNVVLTNTAILQNHFPEGSKVSMKCAAGYVVDQGSLTITCVSGEWSKQELTCKKKDCGLPRSSPNIQYRTPDGTLFGAYITPVCDRGYRLQGSSHRQCLAGGWTGRSQCVSVTCGNIPVIPHSIIVSHPPKEILEFENVIEYRCEDKHTLVGNGTVVCQEDGTYSSLPQCKAPTCGNIPVIAHSIIVSHPPKEILEFKDVIEYRCEDKHTLVGNGTVVCQENGTYSSLPQCKAPTCGNIPVIAHSIIVSHPPKEILEFKDVIEYRCEDKHTLVGNGTVVCQENGTYSSLPQCKVATCGNIPVIAHSIIVSHPPKEILEFEDVIEYRCEDKHTLVGNGTVVCQENGTYSSLPQCKGECPRPVQEGNVVLTDKAILQNHFPEGSKVSMKCAAGYVVDQGSDTITCVSGEWSKQELTCKKKDCGLPRSSPNIQYRTPDGTLFSAYITPVCDRGYRLQGSSHRQCLASGWTGSSQCVSVTCGNIPMIPHSIKVSHPPKEILEFEDVIEYSCEDKHTLVGNGTVVCQENGTYSSLPQCKEIVEKGVPFSNLIVNTVILVAAIIGASLSAFTIYQLVQFFQKRKGSYDTGEEMKTKEALMQENNLSYIQ